MENNPFLRPLELAPAYVRYLDQRLLPNSEIYVEALYVEELISAIQNLSLRGAPLLGLAGLCGMYLSALRSQNTVDHYNNIQRLRQVRPTAIQLSAVVATFFNQYQAFPLKEQAEKYYFQALAYEQQLIDESLRIAKNAQNLIPKIKSVLTHCNTGSLAMGGWGTALGIIVYAINVLKKKIEVYYTETRPLQQGLRLSSFEFSKNDIPASCLVDSAASYLMREGKIDAVIVGADRIAVNGDTANKIGTYMLALSAKHHSIPFFVAAPTSTIDFSIENGDQIAIEYRSKNELQVLINEQNKARDDFKAFNPAFDITPGDLVTAFITEKGVQYPPFQNN